MKRKKSNRIIFEESAKTLLGICKDCGKNIPKIKEIQMYLIEENGDNMAFSLEWDGTKLQKFAERREADPDIWSEEEEEKEKPILLN